MIGKAPLGDLAAHVFLKRHWQKSPCLIRQAFPEFVSLVSPEELAGLACESNVESRLALQTRRSSGWQVYHGPFTEKDFRKLPKNNWTLLVQDTDKHLPKLADFLAYFDFIPSWRIDDLMISYASDGGSVGPHVDAYDVFLLQASGRRRWDITRKPQPPLRPSTNGLKQVRAFKPQQRWILESGDMLYLPPGVAHHGVALGKGMTFSIGFRAPSDREMLADLNHELLSRLDGETRYGDPGLSSASADPGLLSGKARATIRNRLRKIQGLDDAAMDEWFGRFITEPKSWLQPTVPRRKLTPATLRKRLAASGRLLREPAAKLAWYDTGSGIIKLFANGRCRELPSRLSRLTQMICGDRRYSAVQLKSWLRDRHAIQLLLELCNDGLLYFA